MKILLLGHRDIASNVGPGLIVAGLPEHRFDVRLPGAVASRGEPPALLRELAAHEEGLCDDLAQRGSPECRPGALRGTGMEQRRYVRRAAAA